MQVVSYAGGLVAVVLLLAILVLKGERFKQWLYRWLLVTLHLIEQKDFLIDVKPLISY